MRIVALQQWYGLANYNLLKAGQDYLAGLASPSADETTMTNNIEGNLTDALSAINSTDINTITGLDDKLFIALMGAQIVNKHQSVAHFKDAYASWTTARDKTIDANYSAAQ